MARSIPPQDIEQRNKSLPPPWDRIFSLGTRVFVWGLLLGILYVLRPFFLLVFLTFVFAYIQAHGVEGLGHRIKNRTLRVVIVGLVFLGSLLATGLFLAPQIKNQAEVFIRDVPRYLDEADAALHKAMQEQEWLARLLSRRKPARTAGQEPPGNGGEAGTPPGTEPGAGPGTEPGAQGETPEDEPEPIVRNMVMQLIGLGTGEEGPKDPAEIFKRVQEYGSSVLGVVSSFLLALLFSFLIVLDLPQISRGIKSLANTRIGFIYNEVADNIYHFGKVLGRALEAQLFIAIVNTILTALGIHLMGLPNLVFLSAIVFLCSFIPVAGVFISSIPICLVALQEDGFGLMFVAIGLILIIHTIEAYILNPRIFGHHLRMNPVLVLIVLTVAGKLFGFWGLILGLPVVNYVFRHAIRLPEEEEAPPQAA